MNDSLYLFILLLTVSNGINTNILFNRSITSIDADGYYRLSNSDYKCLQRLEKCSSTGWSLRFKMRLNSITINEKDHQNLLFSTGGDQAYGDGIVIYLIQSKPYPYLQFTLKEYHTDQISYNWQMEIDLEMNQWIDLVTTIEKDLGEHYVLTVYVDGYRYDQTILENLIEGSTFKYKEIYPRIVTIYGNESGLCTFDQILYYERLLTDDEISQGNQSYSFLHLFIYLFEVDSDIIDLGCINENDDHLEQIRMMSKVNDWYECREECYQQKKKVFIPYFHLSSELDICSQ